MKIKICVFGIAICLIWRVVYLELALSSARKYSRDTTRKYALTLRELVRLKINGAVVHADWIDAKESDK